MFALTDFQTAAHRLQQTTTRVLARKHSVPGDELGTAITALGDIDNDGRWEFAVTAPNSDVGCGIVHIIRIHAEEDAELLASNVVLANSTDVRCATSVSMIGHRQIGSLETDQQIILAVGAPSYTEKGAVILSTLSKYGKNIAEETIIQAPFLSRGAQFGASVAYADDIDEDGNNDLIIGAPGESAVYVAFLNKEGNTHGYAKSEGWPISHDGFGSSITTLGDVNNDGRAEFLVASHSAVFLLQFGRNGISRNSRLLELPVQLERNLVHGSSLAFLGLDDNDDVLFAIGCKFDNDGGKEKGAVWIVSIQSDGVVKGTYKLSDKEMHFSGKLDEREHFGAALATVLDSNRDGYAELLIGAPRPKKRTDSSGRDPDTELQRRGGIWVTDIPGTRTKKVEKLAWSDSSAECRYGKHSCTCSYRSGQKSECLSLAKVTSAGQFCHLRSCIDSFACGMFKQSRLDHFFSATQMTKTNHLPLIYSPVTRLPRKRVL